MLSCCFKQNPNNVLELENENAKIHRELKRLELENAKIQNELKKLESDHDNNIHWN